MSVKPLRFVHPFYAEPDLFLVADESLFERAQNAAFRLCALDKHPGPVLRPTGRWEGADGAEPRAVASDPLLGSVLWDTQESRYTLWYGTHNRELGVVADPAVGMALGTPGLRPEGSTVCVAYSADGIHWEKPNLQRVIYAGNYDNNMIDVQVGPITSDHLSGVVPNFLPDAPAPLVGTIYSQFNDPIYSSGITQLFSQDGIDWNDAIFPPTLPLDGDAHCLMWDPRRRCYLCTTRSAQHTRIIGRMAQKNPHLKNKRHIALAMSRDLLNWTPMLDILEADEADGERAQLYQMYILPYGHAYLGFVQMFYMAPNMTHGPLDVQLALSTDLVNWRRVGDRSPFVPRGPVGSWDHGHTGLCQSPPFIEGDKLRFWWGGKDTEHWQRGHTGLSTGTIRRDGFACWEAGAETGVVTTVPMKLKWATWPMVNVDASRGQLRVEILGADGAPLPGCSVEDCIPITGDHVRAHVSFRSDADTFVRHTGPVRLRFYLTNARLFAFKAPNVMPGV